MDEPPDPRLTPRKLLADLDSFVATGRREQLLEAFADSIEPLYTLVIEAGGPSKGGGERAFAIFHLLARSITDLLAAVHLATHAYLQQAYTLIRPVLENCDLIELFAQVPDEAARWVNAEKPGIDYRPADVRRRIGGSQEDAELYGHLSEMGSHPRFAGSRVAGLMHVRVEDPTDRRAVLRMGSFHEWHPASVLVYMFVFEAVIRLGFKVRHIEEVSERMSRQRWLSAFLACACAASRGCKLIRLELLDMSSGDGSEFLDTVYDDLLAALEPGGYLVTLDDDAPRGPTSP
jgi:hypothetical protein